MKQKLLLNIGSLIMAEELEKFYYRIENIFEDLMVELKKIAPETVENILAEVAKDRFNEYYPHEPFFGLVFDEVCSRYETYYRFNDIEDPENLKVIEKMETRRREESYRPTYI